MAFIAKNQTAAIIEIHDLGAQIPASGQLDLLTDYKRDELKVSDDLLGFISDETLIINDGDKDLEKQASIRLILDITKDYATTHFGYQVVYASSRPPGTGNCFTSYGDLKANPFDIGNGDMLFGAHEIGDPLVQKVNVWFNVGNNPTYIREGYTWWKDAVHDLCSMKFVSQVCDTSASSGTLYTLLNYPGHPYHGKMIVPAPMTGNLQIDTLRAVEMPISIDTGKRPAAYWNGDWNAITGEFENLTPAADGDGHLNLFNEEVVFSAFGNRVLLNGTVYRGLEWDSSDSAEMGHGMLLQLTLETMGDDHAWEFGLIMSIYRTSLIATLA